MSEISKRYTADQAWDEAMLLKALAENEYFFRRSPVKKLILLSKLAVFGAFTKNLLIAEAQDYKWAELILKSQTIALEEFEKGNVEVREYNERVVKGSRSDQ